VADNDYRLGGLMIWSVDQDDSRFSALSGLVDRKIGILEDPNEGTLDRHGHAVSQQWADESGQSCIMTGCLPTDFDNPCEQSSRGKSGFLQVGRKYCDDDHSEFICCPATCKSLLPSWKASNDARIVCLTDSLKPPPNVSGVAERQEVSAMANVMEER
jgi:hypothetical protein